MKYFLKITYVIETNNKEYDINIQNVITVTVNIFNKN